VDLKVSNHVAVRLGQADYLYTKHDFSFGVPGVSDHQNNLRFSTGVVFRFGGASAAPVPAKTAPAARTAVAIPALGILATGWKGGGVEIVEVEPGSTAGTSGLHVGDVINSIDGKQVNSSADMTAALSAREPGTEVRVGFLIRGQWQSEKLVVLGRK
jgi:predicted metalloprotease with PDZ domain